MEKRFRIPVNLTYLSRDQPMDPSVRVQVIICCEVMSRSDRKGSLRRPLPTTISGLALNMSGHSSPGMREAFVCDPEGSQCA